MLLRSFALLSLLLVCSCSSDRGFRFYGEYEAEQSHYRVQLISQGYVKAGDDLAETAVALVQICPIRPSRGKAFRVILTAAPGQWTRVESNDVAIPSAEMSGRAPQAWLQELLGQADYQDLLEDKLTGSARVIGSALTGPKGVILKGQIKSLIVRRADIKYGWEAPKGRLPKEWIGSSEIPSCAALE